MIASISCLDTFAGDAGEPIPIGGRIVVILYIVSEYDKIRYFIKKIII